MPFTPFHFGPAILVKSFVQRRFWLTSFVLANVLVDLEVLYYLRINQRPFHRYLHTYVGGIVLGIMAGMLMVAGLRLVTKLTPADTQWKRLWTAARPGRQLIDSVGAGVFGGVSHIFLDSLLYSEMRPFWPFPEGNILVGLVSSSHLHIGLMASGMVGMAFLALMIDRNTGR